MSERLEFTYGKQTITVLLSFHQRKSLNITVHPDQSVTARAPLDRSREEVLLYLQKRAGWIIRQQDYFDLFRPIQPERRYISGETHYYLGRQYRLKIKEGPKPQVKLIGRFFMMELPPAPTKPNNSCRNGISGMTGNCS